jgi:hypothetical protein
VVLNTAWSAYCLRQDFRNGFPGLGVAFGVYDLVSRYLRPLSSPDEITEEGIGLFGPPDDVEGFRQLALRLCGGKLIQRLVA